MWTDMESKYIFIGSIGGWYGVAVCALCHRDNDKKYDEE